MTLRHLKIFVVVCQEKSITRAAEKLYIAQPAVSFAIKELENNYGTRLFERLSRKLYITPFGQEVYNYAQRIVLLYDELESFFSSQAGQNSIRIGCGATLSELYMPQIAKDFSSLYPNSKLYITVDNAETIEKMLETNDLDLAIMEGTNLPNNLTEELLQINPIVAICHKTHPLAQKEVVTAEDLAKEDLLLREKFSPTRQSVDYFFDIHSLNITPVWESMDALALINAVDKQLGIAFIPLNHFQHMPNENLTILNVEGFKADRFIRLLYHKDKFLSPVMKCFIQYCQHSKYFESH